MATTSQHIFRNSALMSELVSQPQLDEALAAIRRESVGPPLPDAEISDDLLATKLVKMGVLTVYQADQLKTGRTKYNLGPYLITDFIGQGGMGHVFKGVHKIMGREVAIKVLPATKSSPDAIASFTREIRTQARLDHPLLVRAYDAGHDGKVYYLVCEFVPGTDLRRLVRSQGPLSMQQAARVIRQAALALDYAHQRGLIHRDVKPGNILVTPDGIAKVSDLGLASCLEEAELDGRAGKIVGTADYLSPDQIRDPKKITPAADVYALGCTLYYAATGKVPFPGGTPREKARKHCEERPLFPKRFNAELSDEFVDVIADMMEKDPKQRIATAAEVASRLEPWASQKGSVTAATATRSPWMVPPPPSGDDDELGDTDDGSDDGAGGSSEKEAPSLGSQTTFPVSSTAQDTTSMSDDHGESIFTAQGLAFFTRLRAAGINTDLWLLAALAIAVPLAFALGAFFTFIALKLFGRG